MVFFKVGFSVCVFGTEYTFIVIVSSSLSLHATNVVIDNAINKQTINTSASLFFIIFSFLTFENFTNW